MVNEEASEDANGADIDIELAGQKARIKNVKSLNTICTIAVLVVVSVIGTVLYAHANDTKDAAKELVGALKEMTQVVREANCINTMPRERWPDPDYCKRTAR